MSSSVHVDNKGKDILILGKGPTQGLGEHSLTAKKMYSINFTVTKNKFCLSFYYNGANSYSFVNGKEIHKFKAKYSKIVDSKIDSFSYFLLTSFLKYFLNIMMFRKYFKKLVSR